MTQGDDIAGETRYRTLLNAIDQGFCTIEVALDSAGRPHDYRFVEVSASFERQSGIANATGRWMRDITPEHDPFWFEFFGDVARTGVSARVERWSMAPGRWWDVHAFRVDDPANHRVGVLFRDITDRKRAEGALRDREADLARVQQIGAVGGVHIDVAGGLRGWRSPEYLRLHGLPPDTLQETHHDWLARVVPDDRATAERTLFAALEGAATAYESEYRIMRPSDGAVRWIQARADIERDATGAAIRLVGAHVDVTEQKAAQDALRASEERQAFLLRLSDALRTLSDARQIRLTAAQVLGRHIGANRVAFAEAVDDEQAFNVTTNYVDGIRDIVGRFRYADYGSTIQSDLWSGRTRIQPDIPNDPTLSEAEKAALAEAGVAASLNVPLIKDGRLVAFLGVNYSAPHDFTATEIDLVTEVAERSWAAVERARAEAALRETEERLRQFGEASQDVLWIRDAQTLQWEYLTPAFESIYGLDRDTALGGDNMAGWLDLILPEDRARAAGIIQRVRNGERITFEYRIRRPIDGQVRWLRNTDFPIRDASGAVVRIGGIGHDITALKNSERALAEADVRQRALIEGIPQLVWRSCDRGLWTWASPQWVAFTGQPEPDSHGWGWLDAVHPDDRPLARRAWEAARPHGMLDVEYRVRRAADGAWLWHHTRSVPVREEDGRIVEWLGTSTDIQKLRSLQERQGVLLAELQHRVRNILAIIRSIMRRSVDREGSLHDYAQHLEGRLDALARTQVLLTRQVDANVDLEELIRDELTAQAADEARITLAGPDVDLPPKAAEVLALAMHELATNALKYGAIAHDDATLAVEWRTEDREGARWLTIVWSETGVPVAAGPPPRVGFGTELITQRVPYELKGTGDLAIRSGGVVCTIAFPLVDRASVLGGPFDDGQGASP